MAHKGEVLLFTIPETKCLDKSRAGRWLWSYYGQEIYFVRKGRHRANNDDCYGLTLNTNDLAGAMRKACRVTIEMMKFKDIDSSPTVS